MFLKACICGVIASFAQHWSRSGLLTLCGVISLELNLRLAAGGWLLALFSHPIVLVPAFRSGNRVWQ